MLKPRCVVNPHITISFEVCLYDLEENKVNLRMSSEIDKALEKQSQVLPDVMTLILQVSAIELVDTISILAERTVESNVFEQKTSVKHLNVLSKDKFSHIPCDEFQL